ncbi:MAG: hypothetical protein LBU76_10730, partial [Azoarcus sp.]|nr:hypothetical protein [Azoarcus sp.]
VEMRVAGQALDAEAEALRDRLAATEPLRHQLLAAQRRCHAEEPVPLPGQPVERRARLHRHPRLHRRRRSFAWAGRAEGPRAPKCRLHHRTPRTVNEPRGGGPL